MCAICLQLEPNTRQGWANQSHLNMSEVASSEKCPADEPHRHRHGADAAGAAVRLLHSQPSCCEFPGAMVQNIPLRSNLFSWWWRYRQQYLT